MAGPCDRPSLLVDFEISGSEPQTVWVIVELAEATIAAPAEQSAHFVAVMTVIDGPNLGLAARIIGGADCAPTALLRQHPFVVLARDAIAVFKEVPVIVFIPLGPRLAAHLSTVWRSGVLALICRITLSAVALRLPVGPRSELVNRLDVRTPRTPLLRDVRLWWLSKRDGRVAVTLPAGVVLRTPTASEHLVLAIFDRAFLHVGPPLGGGVVLTPPPWQKSYEDNTRA